MLRLFDSRLRRKVDLEPRDPPRVGIYSCGVTVYDLCHLGHARMAVVWDAFARVLRFRGYEVTYVRNITDVDDKIIKRAAEQGIEPHELAARYTAEMERDFAQLGLAKPDVEPRATDHIPEMIGLIEKLIAGGLAYAADGDVYFAVDRFADYGALSGQPRDELLVGARVEPGEKKRSPLDFALWKGAKPGEPFWESPWGRGRPGWHIECSAMAAKYLGTSFDLHTGGKDLVFPHHENEIAQSQGASGPGTFARHWMHNGFVNLNAEKMSKSLGNFFTIRQVTELHDAEALRLFLLSVQYRSPINIEVVEQAGRPFFPGIAEAERRLEYYYRTASRLADALAVGKDPGAGALAPGAAELGSRFEEALDDDFNTAVALAVLGEAAALANKLLDDPKAVAKDVRRRTLGHLAGELSRMAGALGLLRDAPEAYLLARRARQAAARGIDEGEIARVLAQRDEARRAKEFAKADALRETLASRGIEVMDTPRGTTWRFI